MAEARDILIIDDCLEDRAYVKRLLGAEHDGQWRVAESSTAKEGLARLAEQRFDCLLLDYHLPDASGIDVLDRLRAASGKLDLPVVFLTGSGDELVAARSIKSGALEYLSKRGLTAHILLHALEYAVEKFELTRQRERALEEKDHALALLQSLTNCAPIGFAFLDDDLRFQLVNQNFAELNGLPVEKHIGRTAEEVAVGFAERARTARRQIAETMAARLESEFSFETAAGGRRYWSEHWYPVRGADERMLGTGVVALETTGTRQAEEALRQGTARERARVAELAAIIDALPVVTFIAQDAECRTIVGNRATHELLRIPERTNLAEFLPDGHGRGHFRAMKDGIDIPPGELPLHKAARTGLPVWNYEMDVVSENGERRTLLGHAVPLKEEDQETTRGAAGAFVDITELKRTQDALRSSNEDLTRFASIVAHDLQAPLRTVSMMAQLLDAHYQGSIDSEAAEFFSFIKSGTQRMSRLISDLLEYSRVSREPKNLSSIDSAALVDSALSNLHGQIQESATLISVDGPLPCVIADSHLARVFQNLIGNAIKYRGDSPPEIRVSAQRTGNQALFAVRDNGIGFEMKHAETIFGAFQRLPAAGREEGSGLGLAICKNIVERYGGRIWAESTPGKGSVFYFTAPLCEDPAN